LPKIQKDILLYLSQNKNNPRKDIHFHQFKHEERKYICNAILAKKVPMRAIIVISEKQSMPENIKRDFNKEKYKLFNYMARHLIERISWLIRDKKANVKIIFSSRKQLKIERVERYITSLKKQDTQIEWSVICDQIGVYNHNQRAGLQFADIFATACRRYAFEGDKFGVETSYLKTLYPFLYKHNNKLENYGLKIRGNFLKFHKETVQMLEDWNFKVSP